MIILLQAKHLSTYKNISCRKSHLLVLLFTKLLAALRLLQNRTLLIVVSESMKKFQFGSTIHFTWEYHIVGNFRGRKFLRFVIAKTIRELNFEDWQQSHDPLFIYLKASTSCVRFQISMVHRYHEYQHIWETVVGKTLPCNREVGNIHDPYVVSVKKGDLAVGHVPKTA